MYMHSTNKSVQYVQGAHTLATERTFITLRRGNDLETHMIDVGSFRNKPVP